MAYSTPLTAVSNSTLTAAQWNASVRDNLLETAPAKATTAGQLFVATGANTIAARLPSSHVVSTSQNTASTSYTDLATVGPQVPTLTTGTKALAFISAHVLNNTSGQSSYASVAVSGASTVAANDAWALRYQAFGANARGRYTVATMLTGLTAGLNTFTMQYRVDAGTGTWLERELAVFPL